MHRLPIVAASVALAVLAAQASRLFAAEAGLARCAAPARPVGAAYASLGALLRLAPEAPALAGARGQALLLLARAGEPDPAPLVARMALADLRRALVFEPAGAPLWAAAALAAATAGDAGAAEALAREAVRRAPAAPELAWVAARLARSAPARRAAYRRVTELAPELTPAVVSEAAPGRAWPEQAAFVAPSAEAYRAWAWSVSAPAGLAIAARGLALAPAADTAAAAWLAYYVALGLAPGDPAASLADFDRALRVLGAEQAVHRNHGFALLKAGRAADAEAAFGASLRLYGDLANAAHLGLAEAQIAQGRRAEARPVLERLTRHPRVEAWVRREAGAALYRLEPAP
jgi:tetratricopeptide (TPR) repeat protein